MTLAPQAHRLLIPATLLTVVFLMSQDRLLQEVIRSIHAPFFRMAMEGATLSADSRLLFIFFGLMWVGFDLAKPPRKVSETASPSIFTSVTPTAAWVGKWAVIALLTTRVVVEIAKALIGRERPYLIDPTVGHYGPQFFGPILGRDFASFPSGHATSAAAIAVVLASAFPKRRYLPYLWTALVCLSRVALNEHFVSDVVAGAILGSSLTLTLMAWASPSPSTEETRPPMPVASSDAER